MMRNPYNMCGKYIFCWRRNHDTDGSLLSVTMSVDAWNTSKNIGNNAAKTTLKFTIVRASECSSDVRRSRTTNFRGPLIDDEAPYMAIRIIELQLLKQHIGLDVSESLMPIHLALNGCTHWQYVAGKHFRAKCRIIGSTTISVQSHNGSSIEVCHIVLEGSSQCVLGCNIARRDDTEHVRHHALTFSA